MKNILFILIFFSSASFGQGVNSVIYVPGQGWVSKKIVDSPWIAAQLTTVSQGSVADGSITPAKLSGSIPASKLVGSDITLSESQVTNLVTDLAGKQGFTVSATPATTGTMTTTFTAAQSVFTITPTGACTFNASGGTTGQRATFVVTTSGSSSFVLTWGTSFKTTGTLATGVTTAKTFLVNFLNVAGTWIEAGRTAAM